MANVTIRGLRELGAVLMQAPNKLQWQVLKESTHAMARVVADEAIQRAPVRTGKLSRNIVSVRQRPTKDRELFKVAARRRVYYWKFQEFGSARNPAHPFLRPALAAKAPEATAVFKRVFAEGVRRVMGAS